MNRFVPHVFVLPEDDANRQIANGFLLEGSLDLRRLQILEEARGWLDLIDRFQRDYAPEMGINAYRFMVLLIDFDRREDRLERVMGAVPVNLRDRVFVLGAQDEPEHLRRALGSFETIGRGLAKDCHDQTGVVWGHELLRHNSSELERLRRQVRAILFPD